MSYRNYKPRRTNDPAAPEYVLACYDRGPKEFERYTVLFVGSQVDKRVADKRHVEYLSMSEFPTHPQGLSQCGECQAGDRSVHGRHVRWLQLPEHIRNHVVYIENCSYGLDASAKEKTTHEH